ncbi:MAG: AraC family transcriptional regulator [Bacteroidota bacterium]
MFHVRHPYQSPTGQIKLSQAAGGSVFQNVTKGLALKYVLQGQEVYLIQDEYISLSAGQFMLLREDEPYQAKTKTHATLTQGICVDLAPDFVAAQVPSLMEDSFWFHMPMQAKLLPDVLLDFDLLGQRNQTAEGEKALNRLRQGLDELTQSIAPLQHAIQSLAKRRRTQQTLFSKLMMAKDYISQHYDQSISLKQLSTVTGISSFHLNRSFHTCFQISPQQYQLKLRMEAAQKLLAQPHLSLTQIAFQLGYHDLPAFSHQFKKYYQQTPRNFRKAL